MKHEDFKDHDLYCVQKLVRFIREGSVTHVFKNSEDKEEMGEVAVGYDARDTPIHETTQEGINDLLADGYEDDDDRLPAPEKKPSPTGNTDQPVYKEGWKWSGIYHRRSAVCQQDAANLDGMSKE